MRSSNIIVLTVLLNITVNLIGYFISVDDFSKTTIYWSIVILILSITASIILDNLSKIQEERDELKDNLTKILITKDNNSNALSLTIIPKLFNDKLSINRRSSITLVANSIFNLDDKPSLIIESNQVLNFDMPNNSITTVEHLDKFIYYLKETNVRNTYSSKRYFTYDITITPLQPGIYELRFIVEYSNIKNEESFSILCE
ncbi:hypothetical protein ORD22_05465 [Sporosarcina sp. GW1-11]|uniref:hypothetical protein n=1 Tax=Sporosarcina sp. GW1-11 TaxID=2899126 RepID=UPI00294C1582|nr:hypothetical protein [Sporosarcina sp. GW1-11]MDV6377712.1 hypothetical protein [Sporosarcina sp. GW1-11]